MAITWNAAFNATPAGSDDPAQGDDRIRELKTAIQTGMEHESDWLDTSQANRGWHKSGAAKIYFTAAAPTLRPDGVTALTDADAGRLWMSSATAIMKVYDSTANGWLSCAVSPVATQTISGVKTFTSSPVFKTPPVFSTGYRVGGQPSISYKVLTTGSWNINAVQVMSLPTGLTNATILQVDCMIRPDAGEVITYKRSLNWGAGYIRYEPSNGKLTLLADVTFDNSFWGSTGFDRGVVYLTYKK